MNTIYLDYNSTSPMRPQVFSEMEPYFKHEFGNPSSFHRMGQKSRGVLEEARKKLRAVLGKKDGQIIFTSSATEANNLAIRGIAQKYSSSGHQMIASATEHVSVLKPLEALKRNGWTVDLVYPGADGLISHEAVEKFISKESVLVSLMAANNETGALQPVHELGRLLRAQKIFFHVDAVQVFGKMSFDFASLEADLITISAHKLGGPKGIGALWMRSGLKLEPILFGGSHEHNLRAGTENLPAIIGFVKAAEIALEVLPNEEARIRQFRDGLESGILSSISDTFVNGSRVSRLPNTLNVSFSGTASEAMLMLLDTNGIAASSGSACTSGSVEYSHVLKAMRLPPDRLRSAIRFSLGFNSQKEEIDYLLDRLPAWVKQLRSV